MRLNGRVATTYVQSKVLQGNLPGDATERMIPVYLPPGYDEGDQRYPVIYVLSGHGSSGPLMLNTSAWGESFPQRLDRLITAGVVPPVIAVLPDCWTIFGGAQVDARDQAGQAGIRVGEMFFGLSQRLICA